MVARGSASLHVQIFFFLFLASRYRSISFFASYGLGSSIPPGMNNRNFVRVHNLGTVQILDTQNGLVPLETLFVVLLPNPHPEIWASV
jgi:hypothetical protein